MLRSGALVVYPTETVYGIGADAADAGAIERLLELKGREGGRGISLLVEDLASAASLLAEAVPFGAHALARRFWPGPLTIVLPAAASVAEALVGPGGGVGLRCSSDPMASSLVRCFGGPLTSTSANVSGQAPARTVEDARRSFPKGIGAFLDGGARRDSSVSTVVEFLGSRAYLRRAGAIDMADLAAVVPFSEDCLG
ncbi:MAG TPA: L-threonylcarbamoyladenylate synthase [Candidatus Binatia bacterium]|nr:L-threonylcarbamoyladenylate synthase [Candidatus Binatia bacterium]